MVPTVKHWAFRLLLALASSGISLAVAAPYDLPSGLDSRAVSGWVLSDLNGDHIADLATARSGQRNASGYSQEVRITLGAFQQTSFHFQSGGAIVELIILEPISRAPIGVWINDGGGSFHEGNLADFSGLLGRGSSSSLLPVHHRLALLAISEERIQLPVPATSITAADGLLELIAFRGVLPRQELFQSDLRPRASPARS